MKKALLKLAHQTALKNLNKHPLVNSLNVRVTFIHWSFIVQNNKIVEWGTNRNGVPPVYFGYSDRIDGAEPKIHAELDAWNKAKGLLDRNVKFECINIRLNRAGSLRLSKPCTCCESFLFSIGCSKVFYSTENGFLSTI